ncbi:hypothetical protein [Paenibacillus tyrfis]|uniref:Carboxypeptidase regulatory-like domain-containing protein n=1 Tax=Paenibacillus tyrfis TaxID=1501230 RepID=A0A081P6T8_9BACL|nr:hypothetical protein [Paenibacillus tyrfis]KEQ26411.1 hypothetical protein ET33_31630 [Paenibacillus tyrfis]
MERLRSEVKVKLALVVKPLDVVTGLAPVAVPRLVVEGVPCRPVRKPDGTFLLLGLPPGVYSIVLSAPPHYADSRAVVDTAALSPLEPVKLMPMLPTSSYPFAPGTTLIRVRAKGAPEGAAILRVAVTDGNLACAKLPQDADEGEAELAFGAMHRLVSGRCYYVLDPDPAKREFIRIVALDEANRRAKLQTPFRFAHRKGTVVTDVAGGAADGRGEWAAAFPPQGVKRFVCSVHLFLSDDEPLILGQEVQVEEGQPVQLGLLPSTDE